MFQDKYVHLGGDEVSLDCWMTNPYLRRFMSRNDLYDARDLLNVYTKKLVDIVSGIGETRDQVFNLNSPNLNLFLERVAMESHRFV